MYDWNIQHSILNSLHRKGRPATKGRLSQSKWRTAVFNERVLCALVMLYAKALHSPYAHAKILSMDTSKAEALPGVRAVLRYDDPACYKKWWAISEERRESEMLPEIAHYEGEPVGAFVAADSEEIAEEAIRLIEVVWEERSFCIDIESAASTGAPFTYPEMGNKEVT